MKRDFPINRYEWLLRRNFALSPPQMLRAYLLASGVSLAVALGFAWFGVWYVLCYSALELSGLALAFWYCAQHAGDLERIALSENGLLIEHVRAGRMEQIRLAPCRTRILFPGGARRLVLLDGGERQVLIGRYVSAARVRQVALELRDGLRTGFSNQA